MDNSENLTVAVNDNNRDNHVDIEVARCFDPTKRKSFFLFAGAGSGKTRSLVNALESIELQYGKQLVESGKKVAVITYTNAASEEINARVGYNSIFKVSTIHSFLWDLMQYYQTDIKKWLENNLAEKLAEEKSKEEKAKKSSSVRLKKIERYTNELASLKNINKFTYNPTGQNDAKDSLNHGDVLKLGAYFIENKVIMQEILIARFPVLLIDESQDTNKSLVDAFLKLYEAHKADITIGMFGDMMQRIYLDGKENLSSAIPEEWLKPVKEMNHRSAKRIVRLANSIRKDVDGLLQLPRIDAKEGVVRLFLVEKGSEKFKTEKQIYNQMAEIADDLSWNDPNQIKQLILEHQMAATRLGFSEFYQPLQASKRFKNGLLDGSLREITFLSRIIIPLHHAFLQGNHFQIGNIAKEYSPLLNQEVLLDSGTDQMKNFQRVNESIIALNSMLEDSDTTLLDVIKKIYEDDIFELPNSLQELAEYDELTENQDEDINALYGAFKCKFSTFINYYRYINHETQFDTQQGVKGLEFPRVSVIIDDNEAKGNLFKYEQLFGVQSPSKTDLKNANLGKDTSFNRTARLFYVACTRAEESLAIIAYTSDPDQVKATMLDNKWFSEEEIIIEG